jgi:tRNA pseudouridine55 synthase
MAKKAIPLSELPVFDKQVDNKFQTDLFSSGAVILIDKPLEWSSFHAVKFVRNRIPPKKVGHAGTLDPLATGLLVLCSGKATKSISQIQDQQKTYIADIRFGASTPSYDAATEPDVTAEWKHITQEEIAVSLKKDFSGVISQVPPIYSAIKVKGERLYKLARRGEDVEIKPRNVQIFDTEILEYNLPDIKLKVTCGKGTYIRSLAHDLGILLQSRAHLIGLRRTMIGDFDVEHAFTPDEFDIFLNKLTES